MAFGLEKNNWKQDFLIYAKGFLAFAWREEPLVLQLLQAKLSGSRQVKKPRTTLYATVLDDCVSPVDSRGPDPGH